MSSPKSITIFLPDGNPNGIKIIELSNRNIRAFLIPRAKLSDARRAELTQPALYFLCDREDEKTYIGECENFVHRVKDHDQKKDFWEIAIIFIAKDNSLEKGDVKYLESLAVEDAKRASRMEVLNLTVPVRNNLHEFKAETIKEFYDDLKLMISTLGYPVFDIVEADKADTKDFWFCKNNKTDARGVYNEQGFTILAGSLIDGSERPSFAKNYPFGAQERKTLLQEKGSKQNSSEDVWVLNENITFKSPNKAGGFCVGGSVNAWTTWRNDQGQTMDEVMRREPVK